MGTPKTPTAPVTTALATAGASAAAAVQWACLIIDANPIATVAIAGAATALLVGAALVWHYWRLPKLPAPSVALARIDGLAADVKSLAAVGEWRSTQSRNSGGIPYRGNMAIRRAVCGRAGLAPVPTRPPLYSQ